MIFWLTVITLVVISVVILAIVKKDEWNCFGCIVMAAAILLLLSVLWTYKDNRTSMDSGQQLAWFVLVSERLDAKLEGNTIKVLASKFDITDGLDMELRDKLLRQANYVEYNTYANNHAWLDVYHPDPDTPLLKIEIVK